jgi:biopolymer transport protein ExbD
LTVQQDSSEPRTLVLPKGLEVFVGTPLPPEAIAIQVINADQQWAALKINKEQVPWDALPNALETLLHDGREKVVLLKAAGLLPFAYVVHVIDVCHSMGAKVYVGTPEL